MTPERIAELRALDAARTPGPWETEGDTYSFGMRQVGTTGYSGIVWNYECNPSEEDAAFIVAASTAMPELLDAIEELEAKLQAVQEFAIWMTGCSYDFTQHAYYMNNRHLMTWSATKE